MATRMMGITELLLNQRVYASQVLQILLYLLPRAILFSLPATCLLCVMLTFLRLSSDNEFIALNASGISVYQMLPPVIFFTAMIYCIASSMAIYVVPWGNRSYKGVIVKIVESKADVAVKERIFFEPFDDVMFYVNSFSTKERMMKNLFVVDRRGDPVTNEIVAKKGMILSNRSSKMITIHFIQGTIFTVDKNYKAVRTIKFDTYDLNIDLKDIISSFVSRDKHPREMFVGELMDNLKTTPKGTEKSRLMWVKLFEMFSIPMAIFFMGLIGAPLGAQVRSKGRSVGIIISLVIFLIYYVCLMSVRYISKMGILHPSIGAWIPNLFLLIMCIYLLRRVANDRPFSLFERISFRNA
jgi:lipopolysaccharide export system permease protein